MQSQLEDDACPLVGRVGTFAAALRMKKSWHGEQRRKKNARQLSLAGVCAVVVCEYRSGAEIAAELVLGAAFNAPDKLACRVEAEFPACGARVPLEGCREAISETDWHPLSPHQPLHRLSVISWHHTWGGIDVEVSS